MSGVQNNYYEKFGKFYLLSFLGGATGVSVLCFAENYVKLGRTAIFRGSSSQILFNTGILKHFEKLKGKPFL